MSDKSKYLELCERVRKYDSCAAKWMRDEAPKMSKEDFEYSDTLSSSFVWSSTPQGHSFWDCMEEKLNADTRREIIDNYFNPQAEEAPKRGSVLQEAINTINGERQDVYGNPEDSFALIGQYWGVYLQSQGYDMREDVCGSGEVLCIEPEEVAMMMTLFKIAREANQHKRDNIVDAAGYLGIYADMQGEG